MTPEERLLQRRENYAYYKRLGRCPKCHSRDARTEGGKYCSDCLEREQKRQERNKEERNRKRSVRGKALYNSRKAQGLCTRCGKPKDTSGTRCAACAAKHRAVAKKAWLESGKPTGRWSNDMCGRCCKRPCAEGFKLCGECLEIIRALPHKKPSENHPWRGKRT